MTRSTTSTLALAVLIGLAPHAAMSRAPIAQEDASERLLQATRSIEEGEPARALELLDSETAPAARLVRTRARYTSGDVVGAVQEAAQGLAGASDDERRELLWWGSKGAIALGSGDAADAWTDALGTAAADDPTWNETVATFSSEAARLRARDRESEASLTLARTLALAGFGLLIATGLWAAVRRAD